MDGRSNRRVKLRFHISPAQYGQDLMGNFIHVSKFVSFMGALAWVAGGSGCPRELWSRTRVQKAAQVVRRMGRSLSPRGN